MPKMPWMPLPWRGIWLAADECRAEGSMIPGAAPKMAWDRVRSQGVLQAHKELY